jgi:hypothetical protein
MRSLEDLRFIRDRVLEHIRAHPPQGPLLVEERPWTQSRKPSGPCVRGHDEWAWQGHQWKCRCCYRERKRERRKGTR